MIAKNYAFQGLNGPFSLQHRLHLRERKHTKSIKWKSHFHHQKQKGKRRPFPSSGLGKQSRMAIIIANDLRIPAEGLTKQLRPHIQKMLRWYISTTPFVSFYLLCWKFDLLWHPGSHLTPQFEVPKSLLAPVLLLYTKAK